MLANLTAAEHSMLIFVTESASKSQPNHTLGIAGYYRYEYSRNDQGTEIKRWLPLEPSGLHRIKVIDKNGSNIKEG